MDRRIPSLHLCRAPAEPRSGASVIQDDQSLHTHFSIPAIVDLSDAAEANTATQDWLDQLPEGKAGVVCLDDANNIVALQIAIAAVHTGQARGQSVSVIAADGESLPDIQFRAPVRAGA